MKKLSFLIFISYLYATSSFAAILQIDPITNNITGISGLNVGDQIYDVTFVEGTCVELFSGCDEKTDFFFQDITASRAAYTEMLSQVFVDSTLGQFDSNPALTFGCESFAECNIWTPMIAEGSGLGGSNLVFSILRNSSVAGLDVGTGLLLSAPLSINSDTTLNTRAVFAKWSGSNVSPVPLPASIWLLFSGLIGLISLGRKNKKV